MKKLLSCLLILTCMSVQASEEQFELSDLFGSWQVKSDGFEEVLALAKENFEAMQEGSSALALMLLGMRLDLTNNNVTLGVDINLAYKTAGQPVPEGGERDDMNKSVQISIEGNVVTVYTENDEVNPSSLCKVSHLSAEKLKVDCNGKVANGQLIASRSPTDGSVTLVIHQDFATEKDEVFTLVRL